jgi:hypothetical protein
MTLLFILQCARAEFAYIQFSGSLEDCHGQSDVFGPEWITGSLGGPSSLALGPLSQRRWRAGAYFDGPLCRVFWVVRPTIHIFYLTMSATGLQHCETPVNGRIQTLPSNDGSYVTPPVKPQMPR